MYCVFIYFQNCALLLPRRLVNAFRPPQSCNFCRNIESVPYLADYSATEFEASYAYSGAPVVITDAIQNWTATKVGFEIYTKFFTINFIS